MEQYRQPDIQLTGRHRRILPCQSVDATHLGLNCDYQITIEGTSHTALDSDEFAEVSLCLNNGYQSIFYHGELESIQQTIPIQGQVRFTLTVRGSLNRLKQCKSHYQFVDKTPVHILSALLEPQGINASIDRDGLDYTLSYTAQGDISDYDFLLQFCITHGLVFYYRHDSRATTLHIGRGSYPDAQHELTFNPSNGLVDHEPVITALTRWQTSLPDGIHLKGAQEDEPDTVYQQQTVNTTAIPGQGVLNLSHLFVINNQTDCDRHAACLQAQLDWQREWIRIDVAEQAMQAGDTVKISGHPNAALSRLFRVIDSRLSMEVSASDGAHRCHTTAYLIPASVIYRMPEECTRMQWPNHDQPPHCLVQAIERPTPSLMLAEIVGDDTNDCLDEQGRYRTRLLFDKQATILPPLRQLQPAACPRSAWSEGMHFPLPANTRIILAHSHNLLDKPFILGALPDALQPSPVTEANPSDLILRTEQGCTLAFTDSKPEQTIRMHTQDDKHGLFFSRAMNQSVSDKAHYEEQCLLNSIGSMELDAGHAITLNASDDALMTGDTARFKTDDMFSLAACETMSVASKAINFQTRNDWQAECREGKLSLKASQQASLKGDAVTIQANGLQVSAGFGEVFAKRTQVVRASDKLLLQAGGSEINLSGGHVNLTAPQIILDAPAVIKNQGIIAAVDPFCHPLIPESPERDEPAEHRITEPSHPDSDSQPQPDGPSPGDELNKAVDALHDYGQSDYDELSADFNDWLAALNQQEAETGTALADLYAYEQKTHSTQRLQDKEGYLLSEADKAVITAAQQQIEQLQLTPLDDGNHPDRVHILVAFDGTWNSQDIIEEITNPALLYELFDDQGNANKVYRKGVGTDPQTKLVGGAIGLGAFARVNSAFEELTEDINQIKKNKPGAEVVLSITGFSRGAAEARHFANAVAEYGIPDLSSHVNGYYTRLIDTPRIGAMILFDTVVALGLPGTPAKMGFKLGIPARAEQVLHITANDEHRLAFPLHSAIDQAKPDDPRITQIGLPGAHSDIGGGYPNAYSNIALHLAYTYMQKLGIPLKSIADYPAPPVNDPALRLHDSRYWSDKLWQASKQAIGIEDRRHIYHVHNQQGTY